MSKLYPFWLATITISFSLNLVLVQSNFLYVSYQISARTHVPQEEEEENNQAGGSRQDHLTTK